MLPSGVEEKVMLAVAPEVDMDRTGGRSEKGEAEDEGLEGASGEDGEGVSKGVSESKSPSGVDAVESMAMCPRGEEGASPGYGGGGGQKVWRSCRNTETGAGVYGGQMAAGSNALHGRRAGAPILVEGGLVVVGRCAYN